MNRHDEIRQAALRFHAEHPEVLDAFCRFTLELIAAGRTHGGARLVFERIRWETALGGGDFKLNNNYAPFYARGFARRHPEHAGFFRTREQTSRTRAARGEAA